MVARDNDHIGSREGCYYDVHKRHVHQKIKFTNKK